MDWLSVGYGVAMDWLWAGYTLSISWPSVGYGRDIGWPLAGYLLAMAQNPLASHGPKSIHFKTVKYYYEPKWYMAAINTLDKSIHFKT